MKTSKLMALGVPPALSFIVFSRRNLANLRNLRCCPPAFPLRALCALRGSSHPAKPVNPPQIKNPARVDAAVHQHLRRMDRQFRHRAVAGAAGALVFAFLLALRPRPRSPWLQMFLAMAAVAAFFVAFSCALILLSLGIRRRQTRAKLVRTCLCGYDLRATDHTCPECGRPISDALRQAREAGKDRQYLRPTNPH